MFQKSLFSQVLVKLSFEALHCTFKNIYFEPCFTAEPQNLSANAYLRLNTFSSSKGNKALISLR